MFYLFQRWVRAFEPKQVHVRVATNNGVERQNKMVKYDYLSACPDKSLSVVFTVLVDKFLPDSYRK